MVKSHPSKDGSKVSHKISKCASPEASQSLSTETLHNLNQFLVTQTQMMQRLIQRLDADNTPSASVPTALEDRFKGLRVLPQEKTNCSSHDDKGYSKTSLTTSAQQLSSSHQVISSQAEKERTNPEALHLQAPYRQQDSGHKRKIIDLVQSISSNSKTQARLPQLNQVSAVTTFKPPGLALRPPKQMILSGSQPQQSNTSKGKVQCFKCSEIGHYAK